MPNFDDLEEEFLAPAEDLNVVDPEERRKRRQIIENRSGEGLKKKWLESDRQSLGDAVSRAAPPVRVVPNCSACCSPHRLWIERMLMQGQPYKAIAESIPDGSVSRKSVANHWKSHMALESASVRALLEEEASAIGQNMEEGVRGAFTLRGAVETLIKKGWQDALDNLTTIEVRDIAALVKLLKELDASSGTIAIEQARTSIAIFMEAIQNVLIKGELIERDLGIQLLEEIGRETERLKQEQEITDDIGRHLQLPAA